MKRAVLFTFITLSFLLTASCAFPPHWTGMETPTGEFVWRQTTGTRFYVNLIILGAMVAILAVLFFRDLKHLRKAKWEGVGFFTIPLSLIGIFIFFNIAKSTWMAESFTINAERIERTYALSIWETRKEVFEWKEIVRCERIDDKDSRRLKSMRTGVTWEEGTTRKGIVFVKKEPQGEIAKMEVFIEKESFGRGIVGGTLDFIFGTGEDLTVSPEEEVLLKTAIYKYLPEKVKKEMPPETKEYFSKQE